MTIVDTTVRSPEAAYYYLKRKKAEEKLQEQIKAVDEVISYFQQPFVMVKFTELKEKEITLTLHKVRETLNQLIIKTLTIKKIN